MIELSIALVIIAGIAGFLTNKLLDQRQQELDKKYQLNNEASHEALSAATAELHKQFDSRINKAFENHQLIKTELDSLKLQIGLKGNKQ